jgi:hypothetical protein
MARKESVVSALDRFTALATEDRIKFLSLLGPCLMTPEERLALFVSIPRDGRTNWALKRSGLLDEQIKRALTAERASRNPRPKQETLLLGGQVYDYQIACSRTWSWQFAARIFLHKDSPEARAKCRNARNKYCKLYGYPHPPDPAKLLRSESK